MNTSLNLSTDQILALNNNVKSSKDDINATMQNIKQSFSELETNITGTQVNSNIKAISSKMDAIKTKMDAAFDSLTVFLEGQMQAYTTTYTGTSKGLRGVLDRINKTL